MTLFVKTAETRSEKDTDRACRPELSGPSATAALDSIVRSRNASRRGWVRPVARVGVLVATDMAAVLCSVMLGYGAWAHSVLGQPIDVYLDITPLLLLFPLGYATAGLYPGFGIGAVETLRRLSYGTTLGFLAIAASTFTFKLPIDHSRGTFCIAWFAASVLVPMGRFAILSAAKRFPLWPEPILLVGNLPWLSETIRSMQQAKSMGFRPVAVLSDTSDEKSILGVPVFSTADTELCLGDMAIQTVLIADSEQRPAEISLLQQNFRHVIMVRQHGQIPVESVRAFNLGGVLGIEFRNNLLQLRSRLIKRSIDLSVGGLAFAAALPLILIACLYVKLRSRGPAFFVQEREGRGGRPIKVRKIRTMQVDADDRLCNHLQSDARARSEWNRNMKLRKDPRIIPGGRFLRRFSLDELPQLWSVIRGDLSLVGPRPCPLYHVDRFSPAFRQLRCRVTPGLTGLWQTTCRSEGGLTEQELYDSYYIRNWSLWLDIYLLAKTVVVVLSAKGAY